MEKLFYQQSEGFEVDYHLAVESNILAGLRGNTNQFFYNIDHYLSNLPDARKQYANQALAHIEGNLPEKALKKSAEAIANLTEDYLAILGVINKHVCVGVDMEKEGYPTDLYTRNIAELEKLDSNGQIENDITKLKEALLGSKLNKMVNEGTYAVARLDLVANRNGKPIFKAVVPQSYLEIGGGKRFVFIPVTFYYLFENQLRENFVMNPFKFVKESVIGKVTHIASIKDDVVRQTYKGADGNLVESKIRKAKVGYDVTKQRYFAYDLEASLHSVGLASFRPEMLDTISNVLYEDIDTSRHNVNYDHLRGIFRTKVKGLNKEQLEKLKFIDVSGFANMKDQVEAVIQASENKNDTELYLFMKNNPSVFGDLEDGLAKRERVAPKFLKQMQSINLPINEDERKKELSIMLDAGIVKFTATSKSGSIIERVGSNNPKVLERMLGKDYVKQYESIRNKLKEVKDLLKNGKIKTKLDLEKAGVEYNLLDYVNPLDFFSDEISKGNTHDAIKSIDDAIAELQAKQASRKTNESLLLYRNVYATEASNLFGSVNVNNVIAVDFAEVK